MPSMTPEQYEQAQFVQEQVAEIMPLVKILRDGDDWGVNVQEVFDSITAMSLDDAQANLFAALISILSLLPRD